MRGVCDTAAHAESARDGKHAPHAGGSKQSITKMWDPIAYALGFLDCKDISARCMLSIFHFFATKTDASVLRMLNGSPRDRLLQPIVDYITAKGGTVNMRTGCREVEYETGPDGTPVVTGLRMARAGQESRVTADCYVAALDCQGAKRLVPGEWRKFPLFDNIHRLEGVPVITVQLRCAAAATSLLRLEFLPVQRHHKEKTLPCTVQHACCVVSACTGVSAQVSTQITP